MINLAKGGEHGFELLKYALPPCVLACQGFENELMVFSDAWDYLTNHVTNQRIFQSEVMTVR